MAPPLHIQYLKQRIWEAAKHNLYTIIIAKARINFDGDYEKLLAEVTRMRTLAKQ